MGMVKLVMWWGGVGTLLKRAWGFTLGLVKDVIRVCLALPVDLVLPLWPPPCRVLRTVTVWVFGSKLATLRLYNSFT